MAARRSISGSDSRSAGGGAASLRPAAESPSRCRKRPPPSTACSSKELILDSASRARASAATTRSSRLWRSSSAGPSSDPATASRLSTSAARPLHLVGSLTRVGELTLKLAELGPVGGLDARGDLLELHLEQVDPLLRGGRQVPGGASAVLGGIRPSLRDLRAFDRRVHLAGRGGELLLDRRQVASPRHERFGRLRERLRSRSCPRSSRTSASTRVSGRPARNIARSASERRRDSLSSATRSSEDWPSTASRRFETVWRLAANDWAAASASLALAVACSRRSRRSESPVAPSRVAALLPGRSIVLRTVPFGGRRTSHPSATEMSASRASRTAAPEAPACTSHHGSSARSRARPRVARPRPHRPRWRNLGPEAA